MINFYQKKPVVIEAIQFDGHNGWEIEQWSNKAAVTSPVLEPGPDNPSGAYMQIQTLEGMMTAKVGDFIIKGVKGEFYPCKSDVFDLTYEQIEAEYDLWIDEPLTEDEKALLLNTQKDDPTEEEW